MNCKNLSHLYLCKDFYFTGKFKVKVLSSNQAKSTRSSQWRRPVPADVLSEVHGWLVRERLSCLLFYCWTAAPCLTCPLVSVLSCGQTHSSWWKRSQLHPGCCDTRRLHDVFPLRSNTFHNSCVTLGWMALITNTYAFTNSILRTHNGVFSAL